LKFKTILVLFNVVLIFAFLSILLLPLIIIGSDFFFLFVSRNWYILLAFLIVIISINIYFAMKWKLFNLLEEEKWDALIDYLEEQIYQKGKMYRDFIKVLLNTYLITSRLESIRKLEVYLGEKKPGLINRYPLAFSVPYLLKSEPKEAEKFFGKLLSAGNLAEREWIKWNYAFALMQEKQFDIAREELLELYENGRKFIPFLLTLYFLNSYSRYDESIREKVERGKEKLLLEKNMKKLNREISSSSENMEALILSQIIEEAYNWLNERK